MLNSKLGLGSILVLLTLGVWTMDATAQDKTVKVGKGTTVVQDGNKQVKINADGSVDVMDGNKRVQVRTGNIQVDDGEGDRTEVEATGTKVTVGGHNSLVIDGNSKVITHACDATHAKNIVISGNSHVITLSGDCEKVVVSGNSQAVTLDGVGNLVVSGNSNSVTYRRGIDNKPAKVTQSGNSNLVRKQQ